MLAKFMRGKDQAVWVNPDSVTYIEPSPSRSGYTQIHFGHDHYVVVSAPPETTAEALGLAARGHSSIYGLRSAPAAPRPMIERRR